MYLKKSISNGKTYLSFVQGYRQDGKVKQKTVEKLGYLDDLQKIYPDPIAYFQKLAKEKSFAETRLKKITLELAQTLPEDSNTRKNLGYAIAKKIYSSLKIRDFFQKKQVKTKADFNLNQIFAVLVYDRFLNPGSKKGAFENKDYLFEPTDFSLDDVYRALDHFSDCSNDLQAHLYASLQELTGFSSSLGYYDVTNYYFEIPYEDEDEPDDNGDVKRKGLRRRGPSKEHRPDPIVQMGLLMDGNGMPMAYNIFSGGQSEKTSLRPAVQRIKKDFGLDRVIVVADRGLNTSDNTVMLAGRNDDDSEGYDGYVYGQSVLAADAEFREWVLDPAGYLTSMEKAEDGKLIPFKHKSRIYAKTVTLKNSQGKRSLKMNTYQKQMVYYSPKYAAKQKSDRERVIAKALDLIKHPGKYTHATAVGAAGYVNNISYVKGTGEIAGGRDLSLKTDRIKYEEQFDGYYAIVTSEKDMTDKQMRDTYRGLWEIEESFRITKSEFKARPIYVRTREHINAHFLVCFVNLVILRMIEQKLGKKHTVRSIMETLRQYSCSHIQQNYYLFDFRNKVIKDIETAFGLDLSKKIMSLEEIKNILKY